MYVSQLSLAQSIEKFMEAREHFCGNVEADMDYYIGFQHYWGEGKSQDFVKAFESYKRASENGQPAAMYMLGWMYQAGQGVPIDVDSAKYWYKKAIALGYGGARKHLKELEENIVINPVGDRAKIEWLSSGASSTSLYKVEAGVRSKTAISKVRISVNGQAFRGINAIKNDGFDMTVKQEVQLIQGRNIVEIAVTNAGGTSIFKKTVVYGDKVADLRNKENQNRRVALVVGNSRYPAQELRNPKNDASDIGAKLANLGFKVVTLLDAGEGELEAKLNAFVSMARNCDVALFYYAGHGIQLGGTNYMIPINVDLQTEEQVRQRCTDVNKVLSAFGQAHSKMNIVILDACRNNPFTIKGQYSNVEGLTITDAPTGTLIAYATSPGKLAADGEGRNSPYSESLLDALDYPGLKIYDFFQKITERVTLKTNYVQRPWFSSSLTNSDFYFHR